MAMNKDNLYGLLDGMATMLTCISIYEKQNEDSSEYQILVEMVDAYGIRPYELKQFKGELCEEVLSRYVKNGKWEWEE